MALTRMWGGWQKCQHPETRCVHGDEIAARAGSRVACVICGSSLKGRLPDVCSDTGELHYSHQEDEG